MTMHRPPLASVPPVPALDLDLPDLTPETLEVRPVERSETIPSSWYVDRRFDALDRDLVLGRSWQYVGSAERLLKEGDYLSATVAGNPIVVVRDRNGALRGHFNVCRHRGGPLVTRECGSARMLQCQYHGWTYQLDGTLRGVPRFDRTDLFDKREYSLVPLAVTEWEGLIFACIDADVPPLERFHAGIRERIAPIRLTDVRFSRRVSYDVACNWKVYVDNFLEGYHLPLVHPELCDLLDDRSYATEVFEHYSLQYSPFRAGDNIYGADGEAFYYFVFPNTMLNILPGRLQVNRVIPMGHDRCRVIFDFYHEDIETPEGIRRIEEDLAFSDRVQMEDIEICEHVQRGLESRAYDRGRFSVDAEAGVHHFQSLLKGAYARVMAGGSRADG